MVPYNPKFQYRHNADEACFNTTGPAVTVFDRITLDDRRADYADTEKLKADTHRRIGNLPAVSIADESDDTESD